MIACECNGTEKKTETFHESLLKAADAESEQETVRRRQRRGQGDEGMTRESMKHFSDNSDYYAALKRITLYDNVARLRRDSERRYGLTYEEALEYAYENVKAEAERAIKGRRAPKPKTADADPESKKPHAGGNAEGASDSKEKRG